MTQPPPILVVALGNPDRGDDAAGPILAARLRACVARGDAPGVEVLDAFQLQVEHCLDLRGRERVIFVDAGVGLRERVELAPVAESGPPAVFSHALEPAELLAVYRRVVGGDPPPARALRVRASSFALGEPMSVDARAGLELAWELLARETGVGARGA